MSHSFFSSLRVLRVSALGALCLTIAACHRTGASIEVGDRRAPDDSTSLRIACTPTAESLPFYYAVRSGICDSIGLPLRVKTYFAQFDADTALLGRTVDGGVTDQYRAAYYRSRGKMRDFDLFSLSMDVGRWWPAVGCAFANSATSKDAPWAWHVSPIPTTIFRVCATVCV